MSGTETITNFINRYIGHEDRCRFILEKLQGNESFKGYEYNYHAYEIGEAEKYGENDRYRALIVISRETGCGLNGNCIDVPAWLLVVPDNQVENWARKVGENVKVLH